MLNAVWMAMMVIAWVCALWTGHVHDVVTSIYTSARMTLDVIWLLVGTMAFWLGMLEIAEQAGLVAVLARVLRRPLQLLFPEVPADHHAMGHMVMNISANMLGLGNAATPFGLKAMVALQELNDHPERATDAMCMFLAINTSSVQLLPTGAMALLAAAGGLHPQAIVVPTLVATSVSTAVAVMGARFWAGLAVRRRLALEEGGEHDQRG